MQSLKTVTVFVIAVITSHASLVADTHPGKEASPEPEATATQPAAQVRTVSSTSHPRHTELASPIGFDTYRRTPDLGAGHSPSYGFKHFAGSLNFFGRWHRPQASTLTKYQRCAPDPFRPRGFGHLFARPCDPYRMDYNPYVIREDRSEYGPAYLLRAPDPRCEKCCDDCR